MLGSDGRHGDRADRPRGLVVEQRRPGGTEIGGAPDAAVVEADVEDVGLAGHSGESPGASSAGRAYGAPVHLGVKFRVERSVPALSAARPEPEQDETANGERDNVEIPPDPIECNTIPIVDATTTGLPKRTPYDRVDFFAFRRYSSIPCENESVLRSRTPRRSVRQQPGKLKEDSIGDRRIVILREPWASR